MTVTLFLLVHLLACNSTMLYSGISHKDSCAMRVRYLTFFTFVVHSWNVVGLAKQHNFDFVYGGSGLSLCVFRPTERRDENEDIKLSNNLLKNNKQQNTTICLNSPGYGDRPEWLLIRLNGLIISL